jgi:hypothetical protein
VRRTPELLVLAGLLLALGIAVGIVVGRSGHEHAATPTTTTSTTTTPPATTTTTTTATAPTEQVPTTASPSPPESTPLDFRATRLTPVSAVLTWHTASATVGHVALGTPSLGPARWFPPTQATESHRLAVGALALGRTYRVWLTSTDSTGAQSEATLDVTPPAPSGPVAATVARGAVTIEGQPWFPLMVWGLCSSFAESGLTAGISLFAYNPCGTLDDELRALSGRALVARAPGEATGGEAQGVIGTFYPDEPDGQGATGATLPQLPPGLRFLTLTNHFYSGAAPLPEGRGMYAGLISRADVVGFDLYPLQGWCQPDRLGDVEAAQRELVALAPGKPTFQWIEAAGMGCPHQPGLEVTPATVRAEAWLAIAGGAHGLGFFPAAWTANVEKAILQVGEEIAALTPALMSPPLPVTVEPAGGPVHAVGHRGGGTLLLVGVNASRSASQATFRVPALGARTLDVLGESRSVTARGGSVSDSFGPLAVHIYVTEP